MKLSVARLLSSLYGRPLDLMYAFMVHRVVSRTSFFSNGWGDLRRVEWLHDRIRGVPWPPPRAHIQWKILENGERRGRRYRLLEGTFSSPVSQTVLEALPQESRTSRVRLLVPIDTSCQGCPCVLHLPGTGDQGFGRRTGLGMSLLRDGVASLILESPFYGSRKPWNQHGSRLRYVSDLLTLGRSTIEESVALLYWAKRKGFGPLGVCGLSMGGVHSCMVAALYPEPIACSPLLAPRSAAVAFCEGALRQGVTKWKALTSPRDTYNHDIQATIEEACKLNTRVDFRQTHASSVWHMDWTRDLTEIDSLARSPISQSILTPLSAYYYPDDNVSDETSLLQLFREEERYKAFRRLQAVLEIYTDITQFPIPLRPDAAIFVAAQDDAYALPHSARDLHRYWTGSELRWVLGGHVSSVLFHSKAFCSAIRDALSRLSVA